MLSIVYLVILLNFLASEFEGSATDFPGTRIATPLEWVYLAMHVHDQPPPAPDCTLLLCSELRSVSYFVVN